MVLYPFSLRKTLQKNECSIKFSTNFNKKTFFWVPFQNPLYYNSTKWAKIF